MKALGMNESLKNWPPHSAVFPAGVGSLLLHFLYLLAPLTASNTAACVVVVVVVSVYPGASGGDSRETQNTDDTEVIRLIRGEM